MHMLLNQSLQISVPESVRALLRAISGHRSHWCQSSQVEHLSSPQHAQCFKHLLAEMKWCGLRRRASSTSIVAYDDHEQYSVYG